MKSAVSPHKLLFFFSKSVPIPEIYRVRVAKPHKFFVRLTKISYFSHSPESSANLSNFHKSEVMFVNSLYIHLQKVYYSIYIYIYIVSTSQLIEKENF